MATTAVGPAAVFFVAILQIEAALRKDTQELM
jgi:hypothetical protein